MARPQKEGIDYFPLDVDMDHDDKIQLIEAEHGVTGFGIIIKLLMKIYAESYYYQWSEKEQLLFSKRTNVDINEVNAVINSCLKWGLFDDEVYKKYQILTSSGIQRRYVTATSRRKDVQMIREYTLIDVSNAPNVVSVGINEVNDNNNPIQDKFMPEETPQSKVKESKVKKSKEPPCIPPLAKPSSNEKQEHSFNTDQCPNGHSDDDQCSKNKQKKKSVAKKQRFAEFVRMTNDEYSSLIARLGSKALADKSIEILDNYKGSKGKKYKSDYRAILSWVIKRLQEEGHLGTDSRKTPTGDKAAAIDFSKFEYTG